MDDLLDLTSRVEATHFWFRGFHRFVAPELRAIAGTRNDLRLLDCGCGTGHNLTSLLRPHGRAFGFDLTPGGLLHARKSGFPLARADMTRIPFQSNRFDIVTSFDVLQYVEDDLGALREMTRVLKPGGGLVMTAAALHVLRGGHAGTWPEVRRYTTRDIRRLADGAGLKVRRLTYLFASLFPAMVAVRALRRRDGEGAAADPSADWEMTIPPAPINAALTWMLSGEAALSRHLPMPAGSSILMVATRG